MAVLGSHPRADLLRYLDGAVEAGEKRSLEKHLESCAECREYISFVKGFNQDLSDLSKEEFASDEPCPDSWTLVAYEAGKVNEETARHLRAHLLFCDPCAKEFYALRRVRVSNWTQCILRLIPGAVELVSVSGSGVALEPAYAPAALRSETVSPSGAVRVEDTVVDPETKESSTVCVRIEAEPKAEVASVFAEVEPPQAQWKAYLLDAAGRELEGMPLTARDNPIGSKLRAGSYTVSICKGRDILSSFAIEIRTAQLEEIRRDVPR